MIDLRSDTVTHPVKKMLETMFSARVGDDVFGDDPTVNELEEKAAKIFGFEKALFCPSGTMTNQIAVKIHTQPGEEVICHQLSHIYNFEGGGMAFNSSASVRLIQGDRGRFKAKDVVENINPDDIHHPSTSLVTIENTCNWGGGCFYDPADIKEISYVAKENNLKFHLDGARIFNAFAETGENPAEYGKLFDSISFCLSKGLGAPVGSLLLGSKEFIHRARRIRKVLGGAMRQAGYLAAAGIYALDNHVNRLKEDHQRAKILGQIIEKLTYVEELVPVETNIVIFKLIDSFKSADFINQLAERNIKVVPFGPQTIRMVTHLDFNDDMLGNVEKELQMFQ